jgi:RimJ/RimL family protein N-acetyltransferase
VTREWTTPRLRLTPVAVTDADAFVALEIALRSLETPPRDAPDPVTWAGYLAQFVAVWDDGPLGYWTARRDGEVVGFGGVKPKRWRERDCWNLYYRLHPSRHGSGLATELARAAVAAATVTRPEWPVLVETRPTNPAALAVAERAGLTRRPDLDDDGWAVLLLER